MLDRQQRQHAARRGGVDVAIGPVQRIARIDGEDLRVGRQHRRVRRVRRQPGHKRAVGVVQTATRRRRGGDDGVEPLRAPHARQRQRDRAHAGAPARERDRKASQRRQQKQQRMALAEQPVLEPHRFKMRQHDDRQQAARCHRLQRQWRVPPQREGHEQHQRAEPMPQRRAREWVQRHAEPAHELPKLSRDARRMYPLVPQWNGRAGGRMEADVEEPGNERQ
jgi:hypothetical protein